MRKGASSYTDIYLTNSIEKSVIRMNRKKKTCKGCEGCKY